MELDFFVIGAQKCATSWLYYCLKEHPETHLPSHKKEFQYIGDNDSNYSAREWNDQLLLGAEKKYKCGDVSVEYIIDPSSPKLLKNLAPNSKLILSVRNPVERAVSAFFWNQRKNYLEINTSLESGLKRGLKLNKLNNGLEGSDQYLVDIIRRGLYYKYLENYLKYFSDDQFYILFFDDIKKDPLKVIQNLYSFLDIDVDYLPKSIERKPKKNSYNQFLLKLQNWASESKVIAVLVNKLNQILANTNQNKSPEISLDLRKKLFEFYEPSIRDFQSFIDKLNPEQLSSHCKLIERWGLENQPDAKK
mgnify:CR=1 FL=1